jgi:hypothetical protein
VLTINVSKHVRNLVITLGSDTINQINDVTRGELFDTIVTIPIKTQRIEKSFLWQT